MAGTRLKYAKVVMSDFSGVDSTSWLIDHAQFDKSTQESLSGKGGARDVRRRLLNEQVRFHEAVKADTAEDGP